jgi:hypothetical protein
MNVDRARQRDPVDRQFLIMSAPSCKPGEQNPDNRDKSDDKSQPNHTPTRKIRRMKPLAMWPAFLFISSAPP